MSCRIVKITWLLLTIVLIFVASDITAANTILTGKIYQKDLANRISPLSDAYVEILSFDLLHIIAQTTTLIDGSYKIEADTWIIKAYRIRVSKRGYNSYSCGAVIRGTTPFPFSKTLSFDPYNPPAEIFKDPSCSGNGDPEGKVYSPNGDYYAKIFATGEPGARSYHFTVFRLSDQSVVFESTPTSNDPKGLAWSRDSSAIAVMYHGVFHTDSAIHLFDAQSGIWLRDIVHEYLPWYTRLVFSADNTMVICGYPTTVSAVYPSGFGSTIEWFKHYSGLNLPWINYGWDIGHNPWGGAHGGFSSNLVRLDSDFAYMAAHKVKKVRVWIFGDLRSAMIFDETGRPTEFDEHVFADMDALVTVAEKYNIQLICVLFDYTIADGVLYEGTNKVGEHPELILDETNRIITASLVSPFVNRYKNRHCIYGWDMMNEPEYTITFSSGFTQTFLNNLANFVRSTDPTAKITFGAKNRGSVSDWADYNYNLAQFHYYDAMETSFPFNYPASSLGLKYPVLIGECQPTNVASKLDSAFANGYAGVLFWSLNADYDFRTVASQYLAWMTAH